MSRLRFGWLWAIIVVEVLIVVGLVTWGLVNLRQNNESSNEISTSENSSEPNAPRIELAQIASGLSQPTAIVAMPDPDDKRLFVVEQNGTVRTLNAENNLEEEPFLDIRDKIRSGGEMGLLGLAFHPQAAENNFFYINYTDREQNSVIARYTLSEQTGRADPASEEILLKVPQPFTNHNGGQLAFGPDGFLYIGLGDGGSAGDPGNRAQNKNQLLGKILRIDVNNGDSYSIPEDNPFAASDGEPEIWALGLRNPWRFSFDRKTGDLFIADVGQGEREEINFQPANSKGGENYGWRCFEGTHEFNSENCEGAENFVTPTIEYDHSENRCSVTGGYVYRGKTYAALDGKYFFGDFCGGQIYTAERKGSGEWQTNLAIASGRQISTFGEDSSGELYAADYATGTIYQIIDAAN